MWPLRTNRNSVVPKYFEGRHYGREREQVDFHP